MSDNDERLEWQELNRARAERSKDTRYLTDDLRFRRDEALKYWPAENDEAVPANAELAGATRPSNSPSDKTSAPLDAGTRAAPRYRRLRMRLEEVITHIAETTTGGDLAAARTEFLSAAREGALDVEAKASLFAQDLATIPREDWWNCQYWSCPIEWRAASSSVRASVGAS